MKVLICLPLLIFHIYVKAQKLEYMSSAKMDKSISESSGIVVASDSSYYTINDGGNNSILFEINLEGKKIREIQIKAKNHDWEDLARDETGNIYIGDFGNNVNSRKNLRILKINKNQLHQSEIKPKEFTFQYSLQTKFPPDKDGLYFDCEGFIVKDNIAYLFTKNRTEPFDGISMIYTLPLDHSTKEAKHHYKFFICKGGWYPCSITSADFNFKNNELYLMTYTSIIRIKNFNFDHPSSGKMEFIKLNKMEQFEALCIDKEGHLVLSSEAHRFLGGGKIHKARIND